MVVVENWDFSKDQNWKPPQTIPTDRLKTMDKCGGKRSPQPKQVVEGLYPVIDLWKQAQPCYHNLKQCMFLPKAGPLCMQYLLGGYHYLNKCGKGIVPQVLLFCWEPSPSMH